MARGEFAALALLVTCHSVIGVTIYDLWHPIHDDFECSPLADEISAPLMCHYSDSRQNDIHGRWDGRVVDLVTRLLEEGGSQVGLIDVGAGLGVYSLTAAGLHHEVLAVEENIGNVQRFHKAVKLGRHESRVTLLHNAVRDSGQGLVTVATETGMEPVDAISLDDLPAFCKFRRAILLLHIGRQAVSALHFATELLKEIMVSHIFMEWEHFVSRADLADRVNEVVALLTSKGYVPRTLTGKVLSSKKWSQWPKSIYWHKM